MPILRDEELKCSELRLWKLIEERTRPGADTAGIDQRIWDLFGDSWAVVFTDLAGFSRQAASFGIVHFLQVIFEKKRILLPIVSDHGGIVVKVEADSFLLLFKRARTALDCAIAMRHACAVYNGTRPPEHQILLCQGVGYGEILRVGDYDVFGREVNAASKLGEDTAKGGEILVTEAARAACGDDERGAFVPLDVAVAGSENNYRFDTRVP